jgi:hypothetical protein
VLSVRPERILILVVLELKKNVILYIREAVMTPTSIMKEGPKSELS